MKAATADPDPGEGVGDRRAPQVGACEPQPRVRAPSVVNLND
jgi:hypothetical protein